MTNNNNNNNNNCNFICEKCGREFKLKSYLTKHYQRKTPCKDTEEKTKEKTKENIKKNNNLKPIFKWSGGKYDELKYILPHIPINYSIYLEPFVGGGAVFFHLNPQNSVINDIHKELIYFYQSIKNGNSNKIYEFMKQHPNDETTYYKVRGYKYKNNENTENTENNENNENTVLKIAQKFYYLRKTCFRGMLRYNSKGEFNIPYGRYKTYNFEELKNKNYENLLNKTKILNKNFEFIFNNYNDENNFMFLDPPYDSEFTDYGYCKFDKEEHNKLAKLFKETKIKCLMVIGKTEFIQNLYKDYIVDEYDKKYKFKLHSGRIGDEINTKHLIIKNY